MLSLRRIFSFAILPGVAALLALAAWVSPRAVVEAQQAGDATATPTLRAMVDKSWVIVDLPPDATQAQYGAEIWRLVCSACHGDKGQGLTEQWRSTWAPQDQNCWQSKCHGFNHPPDGFYLPYSPTVVGAGAMSRFGTALDLYGYTFRYMPWHNPNSLPEKDIWAVTAHVLALNGIDPGPELDAADAKNIRLGGPEQPGGELAKTEPVPTAGSAAASPTAAQPRPHPQRPGFPVPLTLVGGAGLLVLLAGIAIFYYKRSN